MEAIDLVMKIWGIEESDRDRLANTLKTTPPGHLGLALLNLAADPENEAYVAANDEWIATHLPEVTLR